MEYAELLPSRTLSQPSRDLQPKSLRERDFAPLRKMAKVYRGLVSSSKAKEGRHTVDAAQSPGKGVDSTPEDVQKLADQFDDVFSSPFFRINDLTPELILCVASFLPPASRLALRLTCRRMLNVLHPNLDQTAHDERLSFLGLLSKELTYAQPGWIICKCCARFRPQDAFSNSSIASAGTDKVSECTKHSRVWFCPHRSYGAEELARLVTSHDSQPSDSAFINATGSMCCGSPRCEQWFSHKLHRDRPGSPSSYSLESSIRVMAVRHTGHEKEIRIRIATEFHRRRLQFIFREMNAPICDHGLLNDHETFIQLGRRGVDVEIQEERPGHSRPTPKKKRYYQRGTCSSCEAAGTSTTFRFQILLRPAPDGVGMHIELRVVLTRQLGTIDGFGGKDTDWKNHAMTSEQLNEFKALWAVWAV